MKKTKKANGSYGTYAPRQVMGEDVEHMGKHKKPVVLREAKAHMIRVQGEE